MKIINLYRKLFQSQLTYPLLLVLAAVAVYFPILGNDFIYLWDDQWMAINHYTESGFNAKNLWAIFTQFYNGQYSPFTELNYLIVYTFFGYNPLWFHMASLLWHIGCVLLVFCLIPKLPALNTELPAETMRAVAFFTALLLAVHPLNVESVAWISAVKIPLYAFFFLWATHSFLSYLKCEPAPKSYPTPNPLKGTFSSSEDECSPLGAGGNHQKFLTFRSKWGYYVATMALFTCSFLAKEQAVVFPVWLILIYWCCNYKLTDKKVWISTLPFFLMAVFFGIVTMLSQSANGGGVLSGAPNYPLWQRIVFACYAFFEYIFKGLFPFKLSYLYPFPAAIGDPLPQWLLMYPLLFIIIVLCIIRFFRYRWVAFGAMCFAVNIAISLHIIPMSRFAIVADRYFYLSCIGLAFAVSYGFTLLYRQAARPWKMALTTVFAAYILFMGVYSNQRTHTWHNSDTLKKELRDLLQQRDDYQPDIDTHGVTQSHPMSNPENKEE